MGHGKVRLCEAPGSALKSAAYLRDNMSLARAALSEVPFAQVMQALGKRWAVVRPRTDDAAHWKALGSKAESA